MESVDQYLRRAAEKVAEKSSDPYIRRLYVDIAEHWRDIASAAREIERGRDLWKWSFEKFRTWSFLTIPTCRFIADLATIGSPLRRLPITERWSDSRRPFY
jgi:hypothetical protein